MSRKNVALDQETYNRLVVAADGRPLGRMVKYLLDGGYVNVATSATPTPQAPPTPTIEEDTQANWTTERWMDEVKRYLDKADDEGVGVPVELDDDPKYTRVAVDVLEPLETLSRLFGHYWYRKPGGEWKMAYRGIDGEAI